MKEQLPTTITLTDVQQPNLLVRLLRNIVASIGALGTKVDSISIPKTTIDYARIARELESSGSFPLNVQGLIGVLANPQPAGAVRLNSDPTGQILQQYFDTQLLVVKNGSNYDLKQVVAGNPSSLVTLLAGGTAGNVVTTDTIQTIGPSAAKTFDDVVTLSPTTGTAALSVTAGQINSSTQFGCHVYNGSNQSLTTATYTALTFDTEIFDRGGCHSTSSNTSRITVPTGGDGLWFFGGLVAFDVNTTGHRELELRGNGTTSLKFSIAAPSTDTGPYILVHSIESVVAGDYVELRGYQNSGGNLNALGGGRAQTSFWGYKLC